MEPSWLLAYGNTAIRMCSFVLPRTGEFLSRIAFRYIVSRSNSDNMAKNDICHASQSLYIAKIRQSVNKEISQRANKICRGMANYTYYGILQRDAMQRMKNTLVWGWPWISGRRVFSIHSFVRSLHLAD